MFMLCACVRARVCVIHWHCSAQLSMFNMEKRYRNKIIIIIIIITDDDIHLHADWVCTRLKKKTTSTMNTLRHMWHTQTHTNAYKCKNQYTWYVAVKWVWPTHAWIHALIHSHTVRTRSTESVTVEFCAFLRHNDLKWYNLDHKLPTPRQQTCVLLLKGTWDQALMEQWHQKNAIVTSAPLVM